MERHGGEDFKLCRAFDSELLQRAAAESGVEPGELFGVVCGDLGANVIRKKEMHLRMLDEQPGSIDGQEVDEHRRVADDALASIASIHCDVSLEGVNLHRALSKS